MRRSSVRTPFPHANHWQIADKLWNTGELMSSGLTLLGAFFESPVFFTRGIVVLMGCASKSMLNNNAIVSHSNCIYCWYRLGSCLGVIRTSHAYLPVLELLVFDFTWWGVMSAAAWIPSGLCTIAAVPRLGIGLTVAVATGTASVRYLTYRSGLYPYHPIPSTTTHCTIIIQSFKCLAYIKITCSSLCKA